VTWDGGGIVPFSWDDADNWDTNTLPGLTDDVVIPDLAGTPTIVSNAGLGGPDVRSINSAERVSLGSLTYLTTRGGSSSFAGGLDLTAQNVASFAGSVNINGGNWFTAFVSGAYTTTGVLAIGHSGGGNPDAGSLTNSSTGILTLSNSTAISMTLVNQVGGQASVSGSGSVGGNINNAGTLRRTVAGTGTISANLNNTGTVSVQAGTLSLTGTVAQITGPAFDRTLTAGTWEATTGGTLGYLPGGNIRTILSGASVSLVGSGSDALLGIFSGLTVAGTLSVTGGANLGGGASGLTVTDTGTVTVGAASSLDSFASVDNAGTVIVAGNFPVSAYQQTAGLTRLDAERVVAERLLPRQNRVVSYDSSSQSRRRLCNQELATAQRQ
jgi:hypothetical protein